MIVEVNVPVFAESITEGTLLAWHKKIGEAVARDEILVDIKTDKVVCAEIGRASCRERV